MTKLRTTALRVICVALGAAVATLSSAAVASPALAHSGYGRGVRSAAEPDGSRVWPVEGGAGAVRPLVSRGWEPPADPWAAGHRGVDLAARPGRPVRAVADGRVSFAGRVAGRGVLSIELSGTGEPPLRTTYEPVRPSVRKGEKVRAGETVATLADEGFHCGGGCLHWGVRRGERYVDPLSLLPAELLRAGPARLLPVFGVPLPRTDAMAPMAAQPATETPAGASATMTGPGALGRAAAALA
ncbi:MAG: murein hydrolase activator EnvC family protein, partial [Streptomyces sp.]|uniref:murein hydrolase activator EnvC family protein n=1 Tax=Streptomyces sp. TaxID=1931 RepID=UPI003D6C21DF